MDNLSLCFELAVVLLIKTVLLKVTSVDTSTGLVLDVIDG